MKIALLDWDSQFFGLKVGKTESEFLEPNKIPELKLQMNEKGIDLLYLFLGSPIVQGKEENLMLLDRKVTFTKNVSNLELLNSEVTEYADSLTDDLINLAIQSGHESRFKKDLRLLHKFESLYQNWLKKSLTGELADKVFVYKDLNSNRIVGFITASCKNRIGKIGLIAVNENHRGKGIGTMLLQKAEDWFREQEATRIEVVTQSDNKSACGLYEKNNYHIKSTVYIYHL